MAMKQMKEESSNAFVKRFRSATCRIKGSTPQEDLVAIYRFNLQIHIIERMGLTKSCAWIELRECCNAVEDVKGNRTIQA